MKVQKTKENWTRKQNKGMGALQEKHDSYHHTLQKKVKVISGLFKNLQYPQLVNRANGFTTTKKYK